MLLLFVALAVFVAWSWLSYPAVGHWLYDLNMAIEAKLYKLHKIEVPIAEMTVSTWLGGPYEAASAILMLGAILSILVPYLYSELRNKRHD